MSFPFFLMSFVLSFFCSFFCSLFFFPLFFRSFAFCSFALLLFCSLFFVLLFFVLSLFCSFALLLFCSLFFCSLFFCSFALLLFALSFFCSLLFYSFALSLFRSRLLCYRNYTFYRSRLSIFIGIFPATGNFEALFAVFPQQAQKTSTILCTRYFKPNKTVFKIPPFKKYSSSTSLSSRLLTEKLFFLSPSVTSTCSSIFGCQSPVK